MCCVSVCKDERLVASLLCNCVVLERSRAVSLATEEASTRGLLEEACALVCTGGDVGANRWEARAERVSDAGWDMA